MTVYVLIPRGVGEKAAAGVFSRRWKAKRAAKALWERSDGYHEFEIHEMEIDSVYDSFPRGERYGLTTKPLPMPERKKPPVFV